MRAATPGSSGGWGTVPKTSCSIRLETGRKDEGPSHDQISSDAFRSLCKLCQIGES